jgi:hypothetical protein
MRVLDTRKGEALRVADACREKQSKQIAEERVSEERSVWESIDSIPNSTGHTDFTGRFYGISFYIHTITFKRTCSVSPSILTKSLCS